MYWTLDTRPPTLDERIIQAKARHAERVDQIAAEEPVPQLKVPSVYTSKADRVASLARNNDDILDAMTQRLLKPGEFFEVPGSVQVSDLQRQLSDMAAQQNMNLVGLEQALGGFGQYAGTRVSAAAAAAQCNAFADAATFGSGFYSLGYQPILKHHPYLDVTAV